MSACTYLGLDDGATPFKLSLFIDVIQTIVQAKTAGAAAAAAAATAASVGKVDAAAGHTKRFASFDSEGNLSAASESTSHLLARSEARAILLEAFKDTQVHAIVPDGAAFVYMPRSFEAHVRHLYADSPMRRDDAMRGSSSNTWTNREHAFVSGTCHESGVVINSFIGDKVAVAESAVVCHSRLEHIAWTVEEGAYVFGVDDSVVISTTPITLGAGLALQHLRVQLDQVGTADKAPSGMFSNVLTLFGLKDTFEPSKGKDSHDITSGVPALPQKSVSEIIRSPGMGTFCNQSWDLFFARTGIFPAELWLPGVEQIAGTARLYPISPYGGRTKYDMIAWLHPGGQPTATQLDVWRKSWRISLEEALEQIAFERELQWRQHIDTVVGNKVAQFTLRFPELGSEGARIQATSGSVQAPEPPPD